MKQPTKYLLIILLPFIRFFGIFDVFSVNWSMESIKTSQFAQNHRKKYYFQIYHWNRENLSLKRDDRKKWNFYVFLVDSHTNSECFSRHHFQRWINNSSFFEQTFNFSCFSYSFSTLHLKGVICTPSFSSCLPFSVHVSTFEFFK